MSLANLEKDKKQWLAVSIREHLIRLNLSNRKGPTVHSVSNQNSALPAARGSEFPAGIFFPSA